MFTTSRTELVSQRYVTAFVLALAALVVPTHSLADPLAIGAVEKYDAKTSTISVLGQQYKISSAALVAGTKSVPVGRASWLAASGALVRIDGTRSADGSVQATSVVVLPELNAPGSTEIFVSGVVTAVRNTGTIAIGKLNIDANSVVAGLEAVRVGDTIEVLGVQPSANGVVLAQSVASARGVGGTGGQLRGVGGTGAQLQGVGGTGKLQGVGGTGATLEGVGGTGKLQGVGGTGAQLQGVGGTGAQLEGVGGTGAALQGVGGTGKVQGVGGTGAQLEGVGGTGAALQGVGGTGKVQGVGGTGAQLEGVGGTGAQLQGVGGTGKTQGVGGTGAAY